MRRVYEVKQTLENELRVGFARGERLDDSYLDMLRHFQRAR